MNIHALQGNWPATKGKLKRKNAWHAWLAWLSENDLSGSEGIGAELLEAARRNKRSQSAGIERENFPNEGCGSIFPSSASKYQESGGDRPGLQQAGPSRRDEALHPG